MHSEGGFFVFMFFCGMMIVAVFAAVTDNPRPMPRLIGHECEGAGGDLWAMEESDFPTRCKAIERY